MENFGLWIFLAATIVASLSFVAVVVWAENRRKEREEFYRFEFRKRLVDAGKMDATAFGSLLQFEHAVRLQRARQAILVAASIFLGIGIGSCFGLQFIGGSVWKLGLIPTGIGVCMLLVGWLSTEKSNPGPPPVGWSPEAELQDESER